MIKAFIFDIDGTLLDSNKAHAKSFVEAFAKYKKDTSFEDFICLIGMGADKILEKFLTKEEIEELGEELKDYRKEIFLKNYLPDIKIFPKMRELFEKIKNDGKQIVLASSAGDDEIRKYNEKLNVSDLVSDETSSDDADESKPEPDIFLAAFKKLKNVEKKETLIIGDTIFDAKAAVQSNIKIIGVESGGWTAEKLSSEGCIKVYKDIAEIYDSYDEVKELAEKFDKATV